MDVSEKVMQAMNDNIAYYNLLQHIIEYWQYMYELNKILVDLVKFLAINFHTYQHKLDPIAIAYVPSTNDKSKDISIDDAIVIKDKKGTKV